MRKLMIAAAGLAAVLVPVASASAQPGHYGRGGGYYGHNNRGEVAREMRECRRELRRADSRREYQRELRECRREIARAQRGDRYGWRDGRRDRRDDRRGYRNRDYRRGW